MRFNGAFIPEDEAAADGDEDDPPAPAAWGDVRLGLDPGPLFPGDPDPVAPPPTDESKPGRDC